MNSDPETWGLSTVQVFRDRRGVELTPLYQAADLLILPSKGEGFPLVVQEYWSWSKCAEEYCQIFEALKKSKL